MERNVRFGIPVIEPARLAMSSGRRFPLSSPLCPLRVHSVCGYDRPRVNPALGLFFGIDGLWARVFYRGMPRKLRDQYPGAMFHFMSRCDRGELWLNHRHRLHGHVLSGRYKAQLVEGSGNGYLKTACDYVHLNPVRAGLLKPEEGLLAYLWSSMAGCIAAPGHRPSWEAGCIVSVPIP